VQMWKPYGERDFPITIDFDLLQAKQWKASLAKKNKKMKNNNTRGNNNKKKLHCPISVKRKHSHKHFMTNKLYPLFYDNKSPQMWNT
jgi:hypothetical protein